MELLDIYIIFGIGYNLISQICKDMSERAFAPTDPVIGSLMMLGVYLWFGSLVGPLTAPKIFVCCALIYLIARFGIYQHIALNNIDMYLSRATRFIAISINLFGVGVLIVRTFLLSTG